VGRSRRRCGSLASARSTGRWRAGTPSAAPVEDLERAQAVARCTAVAAHYHPLRPTCLPRALLLWQLLRRRGLQAQLHIGAQHAPNEAPTRLRAHAWVTHAGTVLNDAPDVGERFAVLPLETALAEMDQRTIGDGRTPLETARIQWLQRRWNPQASTRRPWEWKRPRWRTIRLWRRCCTRR
jgi:hypothetical protein